MVAKITVPKTIGRALNYNEQKVKEGKAHCSMLIPDRASCRTTKVHRQLYRQQNSVKVILEKKHRRSV